MRKMFQGNARGQSKAVKLRSHRTWKITDSQKGLNRTSHPEEIQEQEANILHD